MAERFDPIKAEQVMLEAGLKVLEPYVSSKHKWKSLCLNCNSVVTPTFGSVRSRGTGCRPCAYKKIREHHVIKIEEVFSAALKRGGRLISTEYVNIDSPLDFECSKGHLFTTSFVKVKHRDQWCPTCNKGSKSEEIARTTFEQIFEKRFPKVRPKWLKNSRGFGMEIDGYCKELQIGFEYQGIQHFKKDIFGTGLSKRIEDDKLKAELCKLHGVKLFILTYEMPYESFKQEIASQAKDFGIELPKNFDDIEVDIFKAYIRQDRIHELRSLLAEKNISVLSTKYLGAQQDVELECLICGNHWKAKGNAFFNSRRTAGCDRCNRAKAGEKNKLRIEDLREYAGRFGGELLSSEYVKSQFDYEWKCKNHHVFTYKFNNMKFMNIFCPICERELKKKNSK